jgi:hypothetical protein
MNKQSSELMFMSNFLEIHNQSILLFKELNKYRLLLKSIGNGFIINLLLSLYQKYIWI